MSYIGTYFSRFLNTIFNPAVKKEEFTETINSLYDDLKNGLISFPELDSDFETLLEAIEVAQYPLLKTMSWKESKDGKSYKTGYNPITIRTLTDDCIIEEVLHDLDSEYVQVYVNLKSIFSTFKSLYEYKFYQQIYLDIDSLFELELTQFQSETEAFCHILHRDPFLDLEYEHTQTNASQVWEVTHNLDIGDDTRITILCYDDDSNDISSNVNFTSRIDNNTLTVTFNAEYSGSLTVERTYRVYPLLYSIIGLYRLYVASTTYQTDTIQYMQENDIFGEDDIKTSFGSYISNNVSSIAVEVATFAYRSIFAFNGDISPHLNTEALATIIESLSKLPTVFETSSDDGDMILQVYTYLTYDAVSLTAYWSAIKNAHEVMYDQIEDFFDFPYTFSWYSEQDEVARDTVADELSSNTGLLTNLENTVKQFKSNALYFMNSYFITHGKYARDLISGMAPGFDTTELMNSMTLKDDIEDDLRTFISDNFLVQNDDLVKFSAFLKFKSIMTAFVDGDAFTDWITFDLLPSVIKTVKLHYKITDLEQYNIIDNLKWFFKVFFTKQILDEELFNDYISDFLDVFNTHLAAATPDITDENIVFYASRFIDTKTLLNILNSYYKGAVVSKYVTGALSTCAI